MVNFVLTRQEGSKSAPVGVTVSESIANQWLAKADTNDYYRFEVDQIEHLGFESNGEAFSPAPVSTFELPPMPTIDQDDPAATLRNLSTYLKTMVNSFEELQAQVRT